MSRFKYPATIQLELVDQDQVDWIDNLTVLEEWLELNVGQYWSEWSWDPEGPLYSVRFRRDRDRTLFLLMWGG